MRRFVMHPVRPGQLLAVVFGCCAALAVPRPVRAQGFETVPGGTPASGLAISNQYLASEGVTFVLGNSTSPILAQKGPPLEAFSGSCGDDTPAPGANVGQFFLFDPQTLQPPGAPPSDLIVTYSSPVPCCEGVILDIDQAEAWTIRAYDSSNSLVGTIVLNTSSPGAGDCKATRWHFSHVAADIAKVTIHYSGSTQTNIGYAWDNFESGDSVHFETVPFGSPSSGLAIGNQYLASNGVKFLLGNATFPILAQAGSPLEAFNSSFGDDTTSPLADVGQFFLIDPQTLQPPSAPPSDLIISYLAPVSYSKGMILDIDQAEGWTIRAYNGSTLVDTVVLTTSSPGAGDGLATPWSFSHATADITKVRISYTGSTPNNIGYGWDNIGSIPCPRFLVVGPGLAGTTGIPILAGTGTLDAGSAGSLLVTAANPASPALLFVALSSVPVPFKGGVLAANPAILSVPLATDGNGELLLPFTWPSGVPADTALYFQCAIKDAGAIHGIALSNALEGVTQ
jgi:hypothetical protein